MSGRCESILIWDKEEDGFNVDEESERMQGNDGTSGSYLAVASSTGRISRLRKLGKQESAIAQYLDTIDEVFFGGRKGDFMGWASEQEHRGKGQVGHYLGPRIPQIRVRLP
jgi:hypothetical protein